MMESPRKHGPFDFRYPPPSKLSAPRPEHRSRTNAGLDWAAFVGRFFPHSRRHFFEAVAAYAAYREMPERGAIDHAPSSAPTPAHSGAGGRSGRHATEEGALHSVGVAS